MKSFQIITLSFILLVFPSKPVQAGIFNESTGARSAGLGYTSITLTDIWSAINNQAGLATIDKFGVGLATENKFLLKNLGTKSLVLTLPVFSGSLGASLVQFGESEFNETSIGLAYGMGLSEKISIGIQIFHYAINQNNELGRAGMFSFQGGFIFKENKNLSIAFHFFNPKFITHVKNNPELAEIFKLGLSYHLSELLSGYVEVQNHNQYGAGVLSGIEYHSPKNLALRIGYTSLTGKFTFGLGLKINGWTIDIGSSMHQSLGYSPQLSLSYEF